MKLLLFLLFFNTMSYAKIFTNIQYTITSFPNLDKDGTYTVYSYNTLLKFPERVNLSPMTKINVYGNLYHTMMIVTEYEQLTPSFLGFVSEFRDYLTQQIFRHSSHPGLVLSLTLGNKNFLEDDFMDSIRGSGLAHVFTLSGLHMAMVLGIFLWILSFFRVPLRLQGIILFFPAFTYLLIGGMGISLQRSFLFYLIWAISLVIRIPIPMKKVFITSLVLSLMISPSGLFSVSFLLSYSAVYGLIFFASRYQPFFAKFFGSYLSALFITSICAGIAVIPVLIFVFREINLTSILSSMFIVPLMPLIIMLCFLDLFASLFNQNLVVVNVLLDWLYTIISETARFFSYHFSLHVIFVNMTVIMFFSLLILILGFIILLRKKNA